MGCMSGDCHEPTLASGRGGTVEAREGCDAWSGCWAVAKTSWLDSVCDLVP